jgi:hypothetical protein
MNDQSIWAEHSAGFDILSVYGSLGGEALLSSHSSVVPEKIFLLVGREVCMGIIIITLLLSVRSDPTRSFAQYSLLSIVLTSACEI